MEQVLTFNTFNCLCGAGIAQSLFNLVPKNKKPIFICIGSDLVLGDSLGPLVGTTLRKNKVSSYVYGTLSYPITAKEIEYAKNNLKNMHKDGFIIAVDAAVGKAEDVGLIRVYNKGLKPGLGVNKDLGLIGDLSIIGVVASKGLRNYNLYNATRLNLVYKMAERISSGIIGYLNGIEKQNQAI